MRGLEGGAGAALLRRSLVLSLSRSLAESARLRGADAPPSPSNRSDQLLEGGTVRRACICGLGDGQPWATSAGVGVTPDEAKDLVKGLGA